MAHLENQSANEICARQTEELDNQCFIMAERIVTASAKRLGVSDWAEIFRNVPIVAMDIKGTILNSAGMVGSYGQEKVDRLIADVDAALLALTKRNREADKS